MRTLGQQIRARRLEMGLTLEVLAMRAGCTKGYLSSIETGKRERPPSEGLLFRLEAVLGFEVGVLVERGRWESTPREVRERVLGLEALVRAGARLASMVLGGVGESELVASAERLVSDGASGSGCDVGGSRVFAVRVTGSAMEPAYSEGDVVIVCDAEGMVEDGCDCFVRLRGGGGSMLRRVYFEGGSVRLQPVNCAQAALVVEVSEVAGMARAVWVVRRVAGSEMAEGAVGSELWGLGWLGVLEEHGPGFGSDFGRGLGVGLGAG